MRDDDADVDEPRVFEHEWTVRFADADPFGIAHYPNIVLAVTDVSDRFMESIGCSWAELALEHDSGFPIVEFNVEFERPVRADDVVIIELRPSLGERSARFSYVGRHEDGSVAFTAYEQRAYLEKGADRASAVPDWLREAMAPYLAGEDSVAE